MIYPNIDMKKTGEKLKEYMDSVGVSVKELQVVLYLILSTTNIPMD